LFDYQERTTNIWITNTDPNWGNVTRLAFDNDNINMNFGLVQCGSGIGVPDSIGMGQGDKFKRNFGVLNTWYMCSIIRDADSVRFYFNGVLTSTQVVGTAASVINYIPTRIGGRVDNSRFWIGKIDDIGIWNRALTQCEISALYNAQTLSNPIVDLGGDTISVCGTSTILDATDNSISSYNWITGESTSSITVNSSGEYTVEVTDTNGCIGYDTTLVSLLQPTSSSITETVCDTYMAPDGATYTSTGNYTAVIPNAAGCDSTITLDLTISPTPDNSITQNGASLTATQTGATYQWIDCDNFNAPITGEVNQVFFPSSTGNYAVEVTIGDCSSTSECRLVDFTGIDEIESLISVHPNPTKDEVTLSIGAELLGTGFIVTDNAGRIILTDTFRSIEQKVNLSGFDNGVYFIRTDKESPVKIIKQ
jgi:hypothetical protein